MPQRRLDDFPHQLSGGMRQRVMIAIALACAPRLLLADEPTTALDVTIQAQLLDLLRDIQRDTGMAVLIITHNMGVIARVRRPGAGDVCRPGGGAGFGVDAVFTTPRHPYTRGCCGSTPSLERDEPRLTDDSPAVLPQLTEGACRAAASRRAAPGARMSACEQGRPPLAPTSAQGQHAACHLHWQACGAGPLDGSRR
jgi:peptide/nickel transport system ATP-binding protein